MTKQIYKDNIRENIFYIDENSVFSQMNWVICKLFFLIIATFRKLFVGSRFNLLSETKREKANI